MKRADGHFFVGMAATMLALALAGFGLNGIVHPDSLPPFYPILIIHAAAMAGWYVLFLTQALLVARRNLPLHMRLGRLSLLLAATILLSGYPVNQIVYERSGDPFIAALNLAVLLNFTLLYGSALAMRRIPQRHKRLMLMAGIAMSPPALGRLALGLNVNAFIGLAIYLLLIIALFVHDFRRMGRVQGVTWLGAFLLVFVLGVGLTIGGTVWWAAAVACFWS